MKTVMCKAAKFLFWTVLTVSCLIYAAVFILWTLFCLSMYVWEDVPKHVAEIHGKIPGQTVSIILFATYSVLLCLGTIWFFRRFVRGRNVGWCVLFVSVVLPLLFVPRILVGWVPDIKVSAICATCVAYTIVCVGGTAWFCRWLGRNQRDERWMWRTAILIVLLGGLWYLQHDEPEPKLRYTREMLNVPEDVNASWDVFMRYQKGHTNAVPSFPDDVKAVVPCTGGTEPYPDLTKFGDKIEKTWQEMAAMRQWVDELNRFPAVTDVKNGMELTLDIPIPSFVAWRALSQTTSGYAMYLAQKGDALKGLREIGTIHSVVRKGLPYSTTLVWRMVCVAIIGLNVTTADMIVRNNDLPRSTLEELQKWFPPIPIEDITLHRSLIGEAMHIQGIVKTLSDMPCSPFALKTYLARNRMSLDATETDLPLPVIYAVRLIFPFVFDPHQTSKEIESLMGLDADTLDPHALELRNERYFAESPRHLGNLMGRGLFSTTVPRLTKAYNVCRRNKVCSDLLALEIAKRLGQPTEMKDILNGKTYLYDEAAKRFYSAGEDGIPGNADDVYIGK